MQDIEALITVIQEIAKDVYSHLGPGHLEAPYQKALEVGLRLKGIKFEAQKVIEITYLDHYVGDCNVDLLVDGSVVVELKAAGGQRAAADQALYQLKNYMALLKKDHGVLINFTKPVNETKKAKDAAKGTIAPGEPEITVIEA